MSRRAPKAAVALLMGIGLEACSDSDSSSSDHVQPSDAGGSATEQEDREAPSPAGEEDPDPEQEDDDNGMVRDDPAEDDDVPDTMAADDDSQPDAGPDNAPQADAGPVDPDDTVADQDAAIDDDTTMNDSGAPPVEAGTSNGGSIDAGSFPRTDAGDASPPPVVGQAPVVTINHPGDGEVRDPCPDDFPFIATATDSEDGDLAPAIVWTSNRDGELGTGTNFDACLSSGTHTIVATVVDSEGNVGTDSVGLTITSPSSSAATDDFERSSLGADWQIVYPPNSSQVQIVGDSDLGMGAGAQGFFLVDWVGSSLSADQYCEASLPADVDPNWIHQVYVRRRPNDGARYGFGYDGDPAQANFGDWIFKYDGVAGPDTRIVASTPAADIPGPGDVLRVEVVGYALRGYLNGVLVLEGEDTDSSRIADGRPGLAARWATGNAATDEAVKVYESWSGGSL